MGIIQKTFKFVFILSLSLLSFQNTSFAAINDVDLQTMYLKGDAIMYTINLRTFGAKDINKDGIINEAAGEEKGNFLNAAKELNSLKRYHINTIVLMPVLETGKIKAFGTAGSLYAPANFTNLNPQLKSNKSKLSTEEQFEIFVSACHKKGIKVIVDIPACGSYDMYLKNPSLFKKDTNQNPISPTDWTDVRVFDAGTETTINENVYKLYYQLINYLCAFDIDGFRIIAPNLKPAIFWERLIKETRKNNPQILFIADYNSNEQNKNITFDIPNETLFKIGFDGCNGNFNQIKEWKTAKELTDAIEQNYELSKKYRFQKRIIADFATQNDVSPLISQNENLSLMITWLDATLPFTPNYLDGFTSGDTYLFSKANKKAIKSDTDDEYYFVHRGQIDIFNFSRKPEGNNPFIREAIIYANNVRVAVPNVINYGDLKILKTSNPSVFGYTRTFDQSTIIVYGNINFKEKVTNVKMRIPTPSGKQTVIPVLTMQPPKIRRSSLKVDLEAGEVQVLMIKDFEK